jgi:hypothetical protein
MNKKITYLNLFVVSFLLLVSLSCRKEEQVNMPVSASSEISLQEAKQWFDAYTLRDNPQARVEQERHGKKEPLWKWVINHKYKKGNVLEIPLKYEKGKGIVLHGNKAIPIQTYSQKEGKKLSTLTKLLISKNKQGLFNLRIMKLIGEEAYLKKHNFNPSNNSFAKKESDFTGMVLYYDWNERFVNGFHYEKGKLKGEISKQTASANGGRRSTCSTLYVNFYQQTCYQIGDEGAFSCSDWNYLATDTYTSCDFLEEEEYDDGGGIIEEGEEYFGGGGGGDQTSPSEEVKMPGLYKPGINVKAYLDCFDMLQTEGYTYKLTVYVQEPVPGSNLNASTNFDVGHTCIGFSKTDMGNPSSSITQVVGYYPQTGFKAVIPPFPSVNAEVHDNGGDTRYTVSITYEVTPAQFQEALNAANHLSRESYNLVNNNCTDYIFNIINRAGLSIPQNSGELIYTYGHHPGQLGYDLRALKRSNANMDIDTNEGYTPVSKGPC